MENSRYVYKGCKKLRTGYTTGSCATAATKAALWMLINQRNIEKVTIDTPKGWKLNLDVCSPSFNKDMATCCIIKDSGDDPDITNGIEVWSTVTFRNDKLINIRGGRGVGVVTKSGLQVPVNNSAINPTPMKMIKEVISEVLSEEQGVDVVISIPEGEELAKRTFNPKLGIIGGLSVLGTSGIVEPMSEDALKETIAIELKMVRKQGKEVVILVPGNLGEKFIRSQYNLEDVHIVKMSNYLGFALEKCVELKFKKVLIAGHIGKLIKPAGGIYYTHSRISSTRMEILTAYLAIMGMEQKELIKIMDCKTTDDAISIISKSGKEEVYTILANKAATNCESYIYDNMDVGIILFSMKKLLAVSSKVDYIMEDIKHV